MGKDELPLTGGPEGRGPPWHDPHRAELAEEEPPRGVQVPCPG